MRASRRSAVYRVFSAAVIALLLIALLSGNALAAGTDGLTVETLTFRDVLALYAADRDSFGENASETDGDGVTNAAKRLAEMFTFTVGLNYAGEGLNCNYFGKDISAQMGAEPYTDANRLASYDVEILPYRSYAVALPAGADHDDLGLSCRVHQRRRVRRRGGGAPLRLAGSGRVVCREGR